MAKSLNKIEKLIAELCPNGVEYKELGDVIYSLKTGLNPRSNFKLNTPDAKNYYITVRELGGLNVLFLDKTDRVNNEGLRLINNRSNLEIGDILFSGTGTIGKTALVQEQPVNWNVKEGVYVIKPMQSVIVSKFLLYYISSNKVTQEILGLSAGSTVVSIPMAQLKKIKIPIPPLAIQEEIVKILNSFTELEAELEAELKAELKARRQQHEYYRGKLLNFKKLSKM